MALSVSQIRKWNARWGARDCSVFGKLATGTFELFKDITRQATYSGKVVIFQEGQSADKVYFLCEGQVKLSAKSPDGHTLIVKIARPGDVLGLSAMLNDLPHEVTAETLCPCSIKYADRRLFLHFVQTFAEAGYLVARVLAKQYREAFLSARRFGLASSAVSRIAQLLIGFADADAPPGSCRSFNLTLSHAELAGLGGVSRETVTRILNQLQRQGIISRENGHLTILQRSPLEKLAH
ncbi:MAG: Crp/Fnr family transcriptional regulator [Acidobacteriaceae bacterium]